MRTDAPARPCFVRISSILMSSPICHDDEDRRHRAACLCGGDRLRDDSSVRTYLFQTAREVLYEHLRRHRDGPFDPQEVALAELGPIPSTAYAEDLQQRTLLEALQRIPLEDQITLELYFMEGLRGPELAVVLDVPEAAVPRRIRVGRDRLRALIETPEGA